MTPRDGFTPHFRKSAVTDPWEPLFSRVGEGCVEIGFEIGGQHLNSRGLLHGGVIAALADNAMGLSCVAAMGADATGVVTVSLAMDYVAAAAAGAWLQITPRVLKAKGAIVFADALVCADEAIIARASASFRAPHERGAAP
jgi:uncharacterized protein (TIGR00369 family)